MLPSSLRRAIVASLIAAISATTPVLAPQALADPAPTAQPAPVSPEMQALMKELDSFSEQVSAQNEKFKELQQDISVKERDLEVSKQEVGEANRAAEQARSEEKAAKEVVDKLAASKYRGALVDPLTAVITADGPQNAIDRSAFMAAYVRKAQAALDTQREKSAIAGRKVDEAARLQAQTQYQMNELAVQRSDAEKQDAELKSKIADIKKRIDALSPLERQAWENKNGPVAYSLAGVTSANADGMKALEAAMTKIGAPYGWGAAGPDVFDCSGLVVWSYAQQGKTVPRTSQAQMAGGMPVDRGDLQPGDVVGFYPGATHVGIYAGNGKIVHASDYGIPLQVVNMDSMPFYGARRY